MTTICRRLHRGDDLLLSIKAICRENHIAAGVILSGVGCLTRAVLRDADGVTVRTVEEHCEILSLMGTVSEERCHSFFHRIVPSLSCPPKALRRPLEQVGRNKGIQHLYNFIQQREPQQSSPSNATR